MAELGTTQGLGGVCAVGERGEEEGNQACRQVVANGRRGADYGGAPGEEQGVGEADPAAVGARVGEAGLAAAEDREGRSGSGEEVSGAEAAIAAELEGAVPPLGVGVADVMKDVDAELLAEISLVAAALGDREPAPTEYAGRRPDLGGRAREVALRDELEDAPRRRGDDRARQIEAVDHGRVLDEGTTSPRERVERLARERAGGQDLDPRRPLELGGEGVEQTGRPFARVSRELAVELDPEHPAGILREREVAAFTRVEDEHDDAGRRGDAGIELRGRALGGELSEQEVVEAPLEPGDAGAQLCHSLRPRRPPESPRALQLGIEGSPLAVIVAEFVGIADNGRRDGEGPRPSPARSAERLVETPQSDQEPDEAAGAAVTVGGIDLATFGDRSETPRMELGSPTVATEGRLIVAKTLEGLARVHSSIPGPRAVASILSRGGEAIQPQ